MVPQNGLVIFQNIQEFVLHAQLCITGLMFCSTVKPVVCEWKVVSNISVSFKGELQDSGPVCGVLLHV